MCKAMNNHNSGQTEKKKNKFYEDLTFPLVTTVITEKSSNVLPPISLFVGYI